MYREVNISKFYFSSNAVLDALPKADLVLFKEHLRLKKVRKGKELFQQDTKPKGVYILKRGKVKIYQDTQNGAEQIVYIYTPGEMFGYRPLLCNGNHPASAKTLEECGIYFLPAKDFLEVLQESAALSNILLQHLSYEFTVLVNRIAAFSQKSVKERVALSLLILREKYKRSGNGQYEDITLSRSDLASFVGTTHESIARIITKFKKEHFIKVYGRRVMVSNAKALFQLTE